MALSRPKKILAWIAAAALVSTLACASWVVCIPALVSEGIWVHECPDGDVRQTLEVNAYGLRREAPGSVTVSATAHYTTSLADWDRTATVRRRTAEVFLVDGEGNEQLLPPDKNGWDHDNSGSNATVTLPDVPDGDYLLRAKVRTPIGDDVLDVPLPVYAPARVHVITDRPLYEPGNVMLFRAVVLRARDLSPIDKRPGRWVVTDPTGEVLLEEKAPAGDWGVVSGSFPLDAGAESGDWRVRWESGAASDEVSVRVEPFTLPRFRVDARTEAAWHLPGDAPVVHGNVVYSSGAPVDGAEILIDWTVSGDWPPPTSWLDGELPTRAVADSSGGFTLQLPQVPADLLGQATLQGRISATDPAGDRVTGSVSALLSQDALAVQAVTELADGLVDGFNNRVYLRATTASGTPLPGVQLRVKRAWDPTDKGQTAPTDADGVAAIQLDPGPPVNIVVPAQPLRPPPPPRPVTRNSTTDLLTGQAPSLADQVALDAWVPALEPCARWIAGGVESRSFGLRVAGSGQVTAVTADDDPVSTCLSTALRTRRLPVGDDRLLSLSYTLAAPDVPRIRADVTAARSFPSGVQQAIDERALAASSCLPDGAGAQTAEKALLWRTSIDSRSVDVQWVDDPKGTRLPPMACIQAAMSRLVLEDPADEAEQGMARLYVVPQASKSQHHARDTTMLGYELQVEATADGESLGSTRLRMGPGTVPDIRLRASPVLAKPGDTVVVDLLRGPDFTGKLPDKLYLRRERDEPIEAELKDRQASFKLPDDRSGWYSVEWNGARALILAQDPERLAVQVTPDKDTYAPGDRATLRLQTTLGDKGGPASVSLLGVDESLAQLVPLPGPDDMARVQPKVPTDQPAFGVLDGQALVMGRIQGENAAVATILRIGQPPTPEELDSSINVSHYGSFDPVSDLTDHFYVVLAELHAQARAWEKSAPKGEQMGPETMAELWTKARKACADRGEATSDAYGRPLRLAQLPSDLLELTDPRAVVIEGTRLPEDVENWTAWVMEHQP